MAEADVREWATALQKRQDPERIHDLLSRLEEVDMTHALLKATNVGKWVGKLRRHADGEIAGKAQSLVAAWKTVRPLATKKAAETPWTKAAAAPRNVQAEPLFAEETASLEKLMDVARLQLPAYADDLFYAEGAAVQRERCHVRKRGTKQDGPVVYWMQRDQRVRDNFALLRAQELALEWNQPLCVVFNLVPSFLGAGVRQFGFMLRGLRQVEHDLREELDVPFVLLLGDPVETLPAFVAEKGAAALVVDFAPLRISQQWKQGVEDALPGDVGFYEVDAHNISPVWETSDKQEFAARTIRRKIHGCMDTYLVDLPALTAPHPHSWIDDERPPEADWAAALGSLTLDHEVHEVDWCLPGERRALEALRDFLTTDRIQRFPDERNDPVKRLATSNLSPYIHFGQLSAQRIVLETQRAMGLKTHASMFPSGDRSTPHANFCEEIVVRRELSDNFCHYSGGNYDRLEGAHAWAKKTLEEHRNDTRETVYTEDQLEQGDTEDELWNAAQLEMVSRGKMAGYMRMYWAKKILEWTPSVEDALRIAIGLNDKYELDGRDPNGYVGCMWAIAGVHDRGWTERAVFGKIRFMNYNGCKRKFDIKAYVNLNPESFSEAKAQNRLLPPPKAATGKSR